MRQRRPRRGRPGSLAIGRQMVAASGRPTLETQLLIQCARVDQDDEDRRQLGACAEQLRDWSAFLDAAARHQVLPLVAHSLDQIADVVPPDHRGELARFATVHAMRNLRMAGVLVEVLQALDAAGVPAFPYKGPALAVAAYGNLLLRSFADLDILVPKVDYLRAKAVLESLGFTPGGELMTDRQYLRWKSAHSFGRDGVQVDLQWAATAIEGLSVAIDDAFWEGQDTIVIAGKTVRAIRSEDCLLFICAHGARHHWDRLKWICDVAELIRAQEVLDWELVIRRADGTGAGRVLRMGLILAHSLLSADLPEQIAEECRTDRVAVRLAQESAEQLLFGRPMQRMGQYRYHLMMRDRWRDRLRYLGFQMLQPTDEDLAVLRVPAGLWFLLPILVPLRRALCFVAASLSRGERRIR